MIIGICGLANSGKTTASKFLVEEYGLKKLSFAQGLKDMLIALGVPSDVVWGPAAIKEKPLQILNGHTARHALQTLGTEWGRNCMGEDFWVNQWAARVADYPNGVVCDDVRFPNEVAKIKEMGGLIIRLRRNGAGVGDAGGAQHASEDIETLHHDFTCLNNGTILELQAALRTIVDFCHETA